MANGLEQLSQLMRLKAQADASKNATLNYQRLAEKQAYDRNQDQIRSQQWQKTYDLNKLVKERQTEEYNRKQKKAAAEQEFQNVYDTNVPNLLEAYKGDKQGFISEIGAIGSEYSGSPKNLISGASTLFDSTNEPDDFKGVQFGSLSPEVGYVTSRFVDRYGRAPESREDLQEAISIGYTDEVAGDGSTIPWQDLRQEFSDARTAGRTGQFTKTKDGKFYQGINQKTGEPFLVPIPEGGNIEIKDQPVPAASQDTLTQGLRGVTMLNQMDSLVGDVMTDTPVWSRLSGLLSKGKLYLGAGSTEEEQYKTNVDGLMMLAQSFIKGTPSDFDVKTFRETIPGFGTNASLAKTKIKQAKDMLANEVKHQLAFYKGTNKPIPVSILNAAEEFGITYNSISASENPWTVKGKWSVDKATAEQEDAAFDALGVDASDEELDAWLMDKFGGGS